MGLRAAYPALQFFGLACHFVWVAMPESAESVRTLSSDCRSDRGRFIQRGDRGPMHSTSRFLITSPCPENLRPISTSSVTTQEAPWWLLFLTVHVFLRSKDPGT